MFENNTVVKLLQKCMDWFTSSPIAYKDADAIILILLEKKSKEYLIKKSVYRLGGEDFIKLFDSNNLSIEVKVDKYGSRSSSIKYTPLD